MVLQQQEVVQAAILLVVLLMAVPPAAMQLVVALTAVTLQEAALTILTQLRLLVMKKLGVRKINAGSGAMQLGTGITFVMPTATL